MGHWGSSTIAFVSPPSPADDLARRRADPRYQRLMAATRQAARGGYDAVTMRELARAAGISMTTIYQFCHSKDHLIAEAHLEWIERFRASLEQRPPRGRTAEARVRTYIRKITEAWETQPVLTMTLQRAMYAVDPGVREVRALVADAYRAIMDTAIGEVEIPERTTIIDIIGHVINSVTYGWVTGTYDTAAARRVLERSVHALLGSTP